MTPRETKSRRRPRLHLTFVLALASAALCSADEIPPPDGILAKLVPEHPRVIATAETFARTREKVRSDDLAERWFASLLEQARDVLDTAPSRYEIPDGKRLLSVSRRVLERVSTLALVHQIEPDARLVERAWRELEAAARFRDWNPSHFLDTAEMTNAFGLGYDWLYHEWSESQRRTIREAIVRLGLEPARRSYRGEERYGWWVNAHHNWNQVCNGGIGVGALAIGDEIPDLAGEILHAALRSIPRAMAEYAPDGACPEGPGYWHYATRYTTYFLAALDSALGTDFGLAASPGFADTGLFPIYTTAPSGVTFNFADCKAGTIRAAELHWLAAGFDRPEYAWYEQVNARPDAFDLLWLAPSVEAYDPAGLALDKHFRRVEVATMRSRWNDPRALFVGFKSGNNAVNHSNLDLGSFVLEALGVRWAIDPGADNYNMPGYFDSSSTGRRWTYWRMRAEAHNTIVLDPGKGPDQNPHAATRIERFESRGDGALAVADLSPAYPRAASAHRGIALRGRGSGSPHVVVQDELQCPEASAVWWLMHTPARVEIAADGRVATLTSGDERLRAELLSPAAARFDVRDAGPLPDAPSPDGQAQNRGLRTLFVRLDAVLATRLTIALVPVTESTPPRLAPVTPLAEW